MTHLHRRALALLGALLLLVAQAAWAADADEAFRAAEDLYKAKKYAEAVEAFKTFVADHPGEDRVPLAAYRVGQSYGKQDKAQWPAAAEAFGLCARSFPNSPYADAALYNQAYYHLKAEEWQPAAATFFDYTKKGKVEGHKAEAWYWRAEALYKLKRPEDAAVAYENMLKSPAPVLNLEAVAALVPYARFGLGYCAYEAKQYEKAVDEFKKLLAPGTETTVNDQALFYGGEALAQLKRPDDAVSWFYKLAERYEKSDYAPEALARVVSLETERGKLAAAKKAGDLLRQRYPDFKSTPTSVRLAEAELRAGNAASAEALALELLKGATGRAEAAGLMLLGEARFAQGATNPAKLADAEAAYVLLLQKQPTDTLAPRATARLAEVRLRLAEADRAAKHDEAAKAHAAAAEKACRDYLVNSPAGEDAGVVRYNLALALHYQERTAEAIAGFQQVVAAAPAAAESAPVLLEMGRLALQIKRYADARWAYETLLKHHAKREPEALKARWGLTQVAKGEGDNAGAIRGYRTFIDAYPADDLSRVALVDTVDLYRALGQEDKAQATGQELRKKFPRSREAAISLLNAGYDHFRAKRYDSAIIALEAYVRDFGDDKEHLAPALSNLAASYYNASAPEDHLQRSVEVYRRLAKEYPDLDAAADALYWAGSGLAALGRNKDAAEAYLAFAAAHPDHARALRARQAGAKCLTADKQFAQAAVVLREGAKLATDVNTRAEFLYDLSWALKDAGQPEEAAKVLEELARTAKGSPLAADAGFRVLGRTLDDRNWAAAIEGYGRWLEQYPTHALAGWANYHLAYALEQSNDFKGAVAGYRQALTLLKDEPARQQASFRIAFCLFRANNSAEALAAFDAYDRDFPKGALRPESLFYRGQVHSLNGRWTDAEKAFRLLVKEFPAHSLSSSGQFNLAVSLQNQSRYQPAIEAYDAVIELCKAQPTLKELLSQAYLRRGECLWVLVKYEKALESLATAEQSGVPAYAAPAGYWIGRCLQGLMKTAEARAKYAEVRDKFPGTDAAKQAADALKELGG